MIISLTGPSYTIDSACSSSISALDCAFNSLMLDECDAALVGGANLTLHPHIALQFAR
jgi:fatty acid synthase, animal type